MFSLAYVILPFAEVAPADAIRSSLAPYQRAGRGEMPDDKLAFDDETDDLHADHEALLTFSDTGNGLQVEGSPHGYWHIDGTRIREQMRRLGLHRWQVRFADTLDLDTFVSQFCRPLERDPATGRYGRWLNPLGHWDWWDLGGRFDGCIIGDRDGGGARSVSQMSSGENPGRTILANIHDLLADALDQAPVPTIDVRTDRNIELAATLLTDAQAGLAHAVPASLVLPPGSVTDNLRWLSAWRNCVPPDTLDWLGLAPDAAWASVAAAAYERFHDHWVAAVAYHH